MVEAGRGDGDETLFDVLEMTPREAIGRVEAREIDAALISGYAAETPLAPGLHAVEVARDAQYLVAPLDAPGLAESEAPEEVGPLAHAIRLALGGRTTPSSSRIGTVCCLPGAEVLARCRSYESALSFVEHGLGTAIMPDLTLQAGVSTGPRATLYALPLPRRRTLLMMPEQRPPPRAPARARSRRSRRRAAQSCPCTTTPCRPSLARGSRANRARLWRPWVARPRPARPSVAVRPGGPPGRRKWTQERRP